MSQQAVARKRVANFSAEEKALLAKLIKLTPIVESKLIDGKTVAKKKVAWQTITDRFNRHPNVQKRETITLKRAWDNMKAYTRKARATGRSHSLNTVNGPNVPPLINEVEAIIKVEEDEPALDNEQRNSFESDGTIQIKQEIAAPEPVVNIDCSGINKNKFDNRLRRPTDYIRNEAVLLKRHLENKNKLEMQILETQLEAEQIRKRAALLEEERNQILLNKAKVELEESMKTGLQCRAQVSSTIGSTIDRGDYF